MYTERKNGGKRSAEIKWKDRKKLKKWLTLDEGGEFSEEECFETPDEAKKAFKKYKTEVTELSVSGQSYYAVIEYMLLKESDDDTNILDCSPMQFEVVDKETYETLKQCDTYAEAEAYQQEHGDGKDLYISLG